MIRFKLRSVPVWFFIPLGLLLLSGCLDLRIVGPVSGDEFLVGEKIKFRAQINKAQSDEIGWMVDGEPTGQGDSFTTSSLSVGWHEITAELREGARSVSDSVHVQIISWNVIESPHRAPARAIARDEIGKETWLAVPGEGVYRINDSGQFKLYSVSSGDLPTNDVRDLILYDQEVWVATGDGVAGFIGSKWKMFGRRQGLPSDYVRALSADFTTSRLWLVTPLGLATWDGRSWESIPHESRATSLAVRGGVVWVGTEGGEIHRLRDKIWIRLTPEEERQGEAIQFLVPDGFQPDQIWVASQTKGLAKGHDGGREYLLSDQFEPLRTNGIVMEESSGTLWMAEAEALGILRRSATGLWRRYDAKSVLPSLEGSWQAIAVDRATGTKWLATPSHIVSLSAGGLPRESIDLPDLVPFPPRDLKVKKGLDGKELVLEVTIVNLGRGALEVESRKDPELSQRVAIQKLYRKQSVVQEKVVGRFFFHDHQDHDHYHFGALTIYQLRKVLPNKTVGAIVRQTTKVSWCLSDNEPYLEGAEGKHYSCSVKIQGISRGWGDTYYARQFGQSVSLAGVSPGEYWVVVILTGVFAEENYGNNSSMTRIELDERGKVRVLEERAPSGVPMKEIFDAKRSDLSGDF